MTTLFRTERQRMSSYTPYQRKVIGRYYENRDHLMVQKLGEIASELYLAESEKKREALWERAAKALANADVPQSRIDHVVGRNDPQLLVKLIEELF